MGSEIPTINTAPLLEWLVGGAKGATSSPEVIGRFGPWMRECGLPVTRIGVYVRTLHPNTMGRFFRWTLGGEVEVREAPFAIMREDQFRDSVFIAIIESGKDVRARLDGPTPLANPDLEQLRGKGLTDYVGMPLRFLDGQLHGISFATDVKAGFSLEQIAELRRLAEPIARVAEILAQRRTAASLLSAYVGRDAGERILRGQIQRGHTEIIRCVIWFSDLRNFTMLSGRRQPAEIIALLNDVFECQVPAVERHGGEVLKFIGDGLLAIFPIAAERSPAEVCAEAARAASEAFAAMDSLSEKSVAAGGPPGDRRVAPPRRRRVRQHRRSRPPRLHGHRRRRQPRRAHRGPHRPPRQAPPRE